MHFNNNKPAWNEFLYGLIYPGFLGSMLYDLLPPENGKAHFCICILFIKLFITFYYCLDYLHLYNDMKKIPIGERPKFYMTSDLFTSGILLSAFFCVKFELYPASIVLLTLIPFSTLLYKWPIKRDRKYFLGFGISLLIYTLVCFITYPNYLKNELLMLAALMLSTYLYYVFFYFEKYCFDDYDKKYHITEKYLPKNSKN